MTIFTDPEVIRDHFTGVPELAFDIETSGLSPWRDLVALIQVADREGNVGLLHCRGDVPPWMKLMLEHPATRVIGHNVVGFDAIFMAGPNGCGLDVGNVDWYDTMIGEQALMDLGRRDQSASLAASLERRFRTSKKARKAELDGPHSWMHGELTEEQIAYATNDVLHLIGLREKQLEHADTLDPSGKLGKSGIGLEIAILPTTMLMKLNGMPLDTEELRKLTTAAELRMKELEAPIEQALGRLPNMNSPVQLKQALADVGIDVPNTRKETLLDLEIRTSDPKARLILDYREAFKFASMYNEDFIQRHMEIDGNIHPSFRQLGTDTARYSCVNPNLQQIPRPKRRMFAAPPGYKIIAADYSGLEIRIAATVAQDEALLEALKAADIHRGVASQMFNKPPEAITDEERFYAKRCVFTLLFGGSAHRLYEDTRLLGGTLTEEEAQNLVYTFHDTYAGLRAERTRAYDIARHRTAYKIQLPSGLRRNLIKGISLTPATILNTAVQGTAAIGVKCAMQMILDRGLAGYLAGVVHDEIVMVVPDFEAEMVADRLADAMLDGMARVTDCAMRVEVAIDRVWAKKPVVSWSLIDGKKTREEHHKDTSEADADAQARGVVRHN